MGSHRKIRIYFAGIDLKIDRLLGPAPEYPIGGVSDNEVVFCTLCIWSQELKASDELIIVENAKFHFEHCPNA